MRLRVLWSSQFSVDVLISEARIERIKKSTMLTAVQVSFGNISYSQREAVCCNRAWALACANAVRQRGHRVAEVMKLKRGVVQITKRHVLQFTKANRLGTDLRAWPERSIIKFRSDRGLSNFSRTRRISSASQYYFFRLCTPGLMPNQIHLFSKLP
jgi:hypothetical protein